MSRDHTGLNLTNTGSTPCTLYGFPGVSWVAGSDGHHVGSAATKQAPSTGAKTLFVPMPTAAGGYGECSVPTQQALLFIGYMQPGTQARLRTERAWFHAGSFVRKDRIHLGNAR